MATPWRSEEEREEFLRGKKEFAKYVTLPITAEIGITDSTMSKMIVQIIDLQNKALYETVIEYAKQQGITSLQLLDEEFVKTALLNEAKRRNNDVEEVRHGEWRRNEPNPEQMKEFHKIGLGAAIALSSIFWTCSCCGTWGTPRYKYCPNCGAKMDGKKGNEIVDGVGWCEEIERKQQ